MKFTDVLTHLFFKKDSMRHKLSQYPVMKCQKTMKWILYLCQQSALYEWEELRNWGFCPAKSRWKEEIHYILRQDQTPAPQSGLQVVSPWI